RPAWLATAWPARPSLQRNNIEERSNGNITESQTRRQIRQGNRAQGARKIKAAVRQTSKPAKVARKPAGKPAKKPVKIVRAAPAASKPVAKPPRVASKPVAAPKPVSRPASVKTAARAVAAARASAAKRRPPSYIPRSRFNDDWMLGGIVELPRQPAPAAHAPT